MNDNRGRDVAVFAEALALPVGERAAYLARECGADHSLKARVEALLRADSEAGNFMQQQPGPLPARVANSIGEKPGTRIGRYKLLQQIGEGGCGVVFMAEQEEPVRRKVALKIIKPGMDTRSVIARFEAERQALALMDHPNIAKVFDAGATESGRPYFVMELIRGSKITEYCDQNSLTTRERLELFVQVCHAVQHAHQKGIIHRDIKPSNILVTVTEAGDALPVVIDFGIAKATTNQQLTDKTLFTAFEMLIGTPAYMSPEQAALINVDVDTRTDIYSLGVLLYELLIGSTPFDAGQLLKAGLDEIRRVIREQEPAPPSTRLSSMTAADLTTVAQHRRSEPPTLIRAVRGDLDWIVMKALEKDRKRRYETANGLANDVKRCLANETVSARPPSKFYRFQKLVFRNKLLFTGIGVIAGLLMATLILISSSLAREHQARRDAERDKQSALTEAAKSQQVTQFLEDMLQGVGPSVALGRDTTMLREILDRTAQRVGEQMTNQPAVEAQLRNLLGRLYLKIGNYQQAQAMDRAALAIYRKLLGPESPEAAMSLNDLGVALFAEGQLAQAEDAHREALAIRRRIFGNEHAEVATSLNNLANVYRHYGRLTEAEALTREALEIRRRLFGNEHLEVADSLRHLSIILGDERRWSESEAMAREVLAMRRMLLGAEHPWVASALADVAWAAGGSGKLEEAEALEREALAMRRKLLKEDHPDIAKSLYLVGDRMRQRGRLTESFSIVSAALSIQRKLLGEENPATLDSLRSLGLTLRAEGKLAEAEAAHREAVTSWRKRGESETPRALDEVENFARVLLAQRKLREAELLLDEVLNPALVKRPAVASLLLLRLDLKARRSQWPEAALDAVRYFELRPNDIERFSTIAALLVKSNDRSAYQLFCKKLVSAYADTTNIFVADQVAKSCLFGSDSGVDLTVISRLADYTVTAGADNEGALPYFQLCKALAEFRRGHFAEAGKWAESALQSQRPEAEQPAYAVLAMAQWRLGNQDTARAALAKGEKLAPQILPQSYTNDLENTWVPWLFARVSLDEAGQLIRAASTTDDPAKKP